MLLTYLPSPPHPPGIVGDLRKICDFIALTMPLGDFTEKVFNRLLPNEPAAATLEAS